MGPAISRSGTSSSIIINSVFLLSGLHLHLRSTAPVRKFNWTLPGLSRRPSKLFSGTKSLGTFAEDGLFDVARGRLGDLHRGLGYDCGNHFDRLRDRGSACVRGRFRDQLPLDQCLWCCSRALVTHPGGDRHPRRVGVLVARPKARRLYAANRWCTGPAAIPGHESFQRAVLGQDTQQVVNMGKPDIGSPPK